MRLDRSHPHVPPLTVKREAVWCTVWSIKHLEGFISVSIRQHRNMRDVVYTHFHVDHLLLKPLLNIYGYIWRIFLTKILNKVQHQQWFLLRWTEAALLSVLPGILTLLCLPCMRLYVTFSRNLLVFNLAHSVRSPCCRYSHQDSECIVQSVHFLMYREVSGPAFTTCTSLTVHCKITLRIARHYVVQPVLICF